MYNTSDCELGSFVSKFRNLWATGKVAQLNVTMGWPPWVSGCSSGALLPLYTGTAVSTSNSRV